MKVRLYIEVPLIAETEDRLTELQTLIAQGAQVQVNVLNRDPAPVWFGNLTGAIQVHT